MNETRDLPECRQLMLPLLRIAAGGETNLRQAVEQLSAELGLEPAPRAAPRPGRRFSVIDNRARWARTHMIRAGLIERRQRGAFRATAHGRALLAAGPARIDLSALATMPETERPARVSVIAAAPETDAELARALIDRILGMPLRSAFFEELVIDLLTAMGYGNGLAVADPARPQQRRRRRRRRDPADPLGLDRPTCRPIATRRPPRRRPRGARLRRQPRGQKTARGVLITTSGFTRGARGLVRGIPRPIALIDGAGLARLMIAHRVGVKQGRTGTKEVNERISNRGTGLLVWPEHLDRLQRGVLQRLSTPACRRYIGESRSARRPGLRVGALHPGQACATIPDYAGLHPRYCAAIKAERKGRRKSNCLSRSSLLPHSAPAAAQNTERLDDFRMRRAIRPSSRRSRRACSSFTTTCRRTPASW